MKRSFIGIALSIVLLFAFSTQTAFAGTFNAAQDYVYKYLASHRYSGTKEPIPAPTADVASGTYSSSLAVQLNNKDRDHYTIYYTLDGTKPTTGSKVYNKPIKLLSSCSLKALSADSSGNMSELLSNTYTILSQPAKTDKTAATMPWASSSAPTPAPSATPSASPTSAPSVSPSPSPSVLPSASPSATPTPASQVPAPAPLPSTAPLSPSTLSTWVAYWDWQTGLDEVSAMGQTPGSIELFGASFNSDDKLFYPDEMQSLPAAAKALQSSHPGMQVYLTVVNDRQASNGKWTDKDSGLLDRIMKSDASRTANINDIVNMATQGGYNGVEIDYEEFSDTAWKGFTVYISQLYSALQAKGLGMRVCLEEYAPFDAGALPAGPEYTLMAYSLHWEDSDPGPRADYAFIKDVAQKLSTLQGNKRMAFAAGGFDWSNGSGKELEEQEAAKLAQKSTDLQRDSQSGALHFTYKSNGATHTVWYSDAQTIKSWMDESKSLGISNVALWKMGGNSADAVQMLGGR